MEFESLARLSDGELLAQVRRLVHCERRTMAALVAHLGEIHERKLYLEQGCGSLFSYCTQVLHLSEHAAYNRIEAARAARRFPAILAYLARGDLHLTAVRLLSPHLTPENHLAILADATHKSKHDLEELIASLRPQSDVPAVVRKLPAARSAGAPTGTDEQAIAASHEQCSLHLAGNGPDITAAQLAGTNDSATVRLAEADLAASQSADIGITAKPADNTDPAAEAAAARVAPTSSSTARAGSVVPLAPGRYKVQFTADAPTYDKLRRAQELLRHRIPNGDLAQVVAVALDRLVRDLEKRKFGKTDRPRRGRPAKQRRSRYIPVAVKRAVWLRDGGRCTFTDPSGTPCTERGQIEFDHRWPHGDGGGSSEDNVRLLCRSHNQYEAWRFFGAWPAASAPHG